MLDIDIDRVPGWNNFLELNSQLRLLGASEEGFDPRRSAEILKEFENLVSPKDYNAVVRDFKS